MQANRVRSEFLTSTGSCTCESTIAKHKSVVNFPGSMLCIVFPVMHVFSAYVIDVCQVQCTLVLAGFHSSLDCCSSFTYL